MGTSLGLEEDPEEEDPCHGGSYEMFTRLNDQRHYPPKLLLYM